MQLNAHNKVPLHRNAVIGILAWWTSCYMWFSSDYFKTACFLCWNQFWARESGIPTVITIKSSTHARFRTSVSFHNIHTRHDSHSLTRHNLHSEPQI